MARRPGFTLVELMVSMAILAVLLASLIPLVGGARAAALKVVCTSRLKDLAFATSQYFHDNGGVYPLQPGTTLTPAAAGTIKADSSLSPSSLLTTPKPTDMDPAFLNLFAEYLRYPKISTNAPASDLPHAVQCPTMEDAPDAPRVLYADLALTRPTMYTGYAYCVRPHDKTLAPGTTLLRPDHVAELKSATTSVLWADDIHWSALDAEWGFAHSVPRAAHGHRLLSFAAPAGLLGQHVAHGDGHVEWVAASEIDLDVSKNATSNPVASLSMFGVYFYWF
jgi:prepilin-type N-terminal cleavage/methylation domain-containing protein